MRSYQKRKFRRIVEVTRQALNSTSAEEHIGILTISYEMARKYNPFLTRVWFFRHLRMAGLKGITYAPLYKGADKDPYGVVSYFADSDPEDLWGEQTGLTPAYLPMIEEWQARRKERKALERQMQSPCYNCEGEDCICCSYRELRYPTMEFSTIW